MSITLSGDKELIMLLTRLGDQMDDAIDKGVFITAQGVRNTAVKSIQDSSTGKTVTRYSQGGNPYKHNASLPGQAPNTDTGNLVGKIGQEKIKDADYEVGTTVEYGEFLEFGTSKMKARPWLHPALEANKEKLRSNVIKAANTLLRRKK